MPDMDNLVADIKMGSVKSVFEYGESRLARPLPRVVVVPGNGASGDTYTWQIWADFPVEKPRELDRYVRGELPFLLSFRRDSCGKKVWRYGNNYDGVMTGQDGSQNYLRAGLAVKLPKVLKGFSADVSA